MSEELEILKKIAKSTEETANSMRILAGDTKEMKQAIAEMKEDSASAASPGAVQQQSRLRLEELRGKVERGESVSYDDFVDVEGQGSRASSTRPGVVGLFESLGRSQFPNREQTIGRAAYSPAFLGGGSRTDKMRFAGALLSNAFASKYRPADGAAYDPSTGERVPYASGKRLSEIGGADAASISGSSTYQNMVLSAAQGQQLPAEMQTHLDTLQNFSSTSQERSAAASALGDHLNVLKRGTNLTDLAKNPMAGKAVEALAGSGRMYGALASLGTGAMAASEFIAGPAAAAYEAGRIAYGFTKGTIYDPARSAAGLGYGFSYNPFSQGATVSMGRSLQTRMDSLLSMGISGEQTAAARAAIEGMGAGGPGSEKMYNDYYGSMRDVIQNTQLSAQTLSPFYEQFMRQGGQGDEVEKLTKMLRDDLPKAAAASRMSLEQMAQAVQATTEAVSQSPYNVRTKTQISQSIIDAQQAGAPPGMASIAGGMNPLINAQTANRLGINYFQAMQQGSQLDITAAESLKSTLGANVRTAEDFDNLMADPQGSLKIMMAQQMTGMSVDDMRKLYSQGIDNFIGAQGLQTKLSDTLRTGTQKSVDKNSFRVINDGINPDTGLPRKKVVYDTKTTSEMLKGTDVNLYKDTGAKLDKAYDPVIKTLESSLRAMDPAAEKDFEKQLKDLRGKPANETFKLLQETARTVQGASATGAGKITLSDEARKYFKLTYGNGYKDPNPPNAQVNIGSVHLGIGG
jgi:hypothetical protein